MGVLFSLVVITVLILLVLIGVSALGLTTLFAVVIPYFAFATFIIGIVYRVILWARAPVPFRITTTCGQQKSLPWIKQNKLDNPFTGFQAFMRMVLEILLFRSLFRNTKSELRKGPRLVYGSNKWLWLGALAFHYSFLIILLRHFRYFAEPVPGFVTLLQNVDGFFQIGLPIVYLTDIIIVCALLYLFFRRVVSPQLRYISLASDYFPLFLILGIATTGILMRYFTKVDLIAVKELGTGLLSLHPVVPADAGVMFYIHLFFVSTLLAYFPFSKLLHMPGIFLSPTRNLANNNRFKRHINPWNPDVAVHTYEEWEEEFKDKLKMAGIPLDKE